MLYLEEKQQHRGKLPYDIPVYYEMFPILPFLKKNGPLKCPIFGQMALIIIFYPVTLLLEFDEFFEKFNLANNL